MSRVGPIVVRVGITALICAVLAVVMAAVGVSVNLLGFVIMVVVIAMPWPQWANGRRAHGVYVLVGLVVVAESVLTGHWGRALLFAVLGLVNLRAYQLKRLDAAKARHPSNG